MVKGTNYTAMRDTTPFASFLPLNGFIMRPPRKRDRETTAICFRTTW